MADLKIDGLGPLRYTPLARPLTEEPQNDFKATLRSAIQDVNELQTHAGEKLEQLVAGEEVDLHEVMIASSEAGIAFDLMMEIRNKLLEAYQEIQRMNV